MRAYADAEDRLSLWRRFLIDTRPTAVAEIGVYRGIFAEMALQATDSIDVYYMIDPWRHLRDWDKPFNVDDDEFARVHDEAMARTAFADERRVVLRGTSAEKVDQIPDASLDLAYVDGDHSLRGITNDLLRIWPKMRPGGVVGCDDFVPRSGSTPARSSPRSCSRTASTSPRPWVPLPGRSRTASSRSRCRAGPVTARASTTSSAATATRA